MNVQEQLSAIQEAGTSNYVSDRADEMDKTIYADMPIDQVERIIDVLQSPVSFHHGAEIVGADEIPEYHTTVYEQAPYQVANLSHWVGCHSPSHYWRNGHNRPNSDHKSYVATSHMNTKQYHKHCEVHSKRRRYHGIAHICLDKAGRVRMPKTARRRRNSLQGLTDFLSK